jgi:hypothetical protein
MGIQNICLWIVVFGRGVLGENHPNHPLNSECVLKFELSHKIKFWNNVNCLDFQAINCFGINIALYLRKMNDSMENYEFV